jgi:two-component system sensor histidine kinase HydH
VRSPEASIGSWRSTANWVESGILVASIAGIGVLQYVTPLSLAHRLYIIQRLYFVPIIIAALRGGWRGGTCVGLLAAVAFWIGTPPLWVVPPAEKLDEVLEASVFCTVGALAGALADRQRRQELVLRRTSAELDRAHRQLRANLQFMARSERLHSLGQLSAGLAHEIRNPLASIEGAALIMQREAHNEERRREFLDIIQKESRRLNRMLTHFLDFARPRGPALQNIAIDALLSSVLELARHAGCRSKFEFRKEIQPGLVNICCDSEQIKQVLLNLLMNAIQAMPQGGCIGLVAQRMDSGIAIDVRDQGCGITPRDLDRVFDPFYTTKTSGSGLGLSIAHQIVTQHGGTLKILRNSSTGVTVRVYIPGTRSL